MPGNLVLEHLAQNSVYRRTWLLSKALEIEPLDRAIELARIADKFVTAEARPAQKSSPEGDVRADIQLPTPCEEPSLLRATAEAHELPRSATAQFSDEERERLIDRMVLGATNAELAAELRRSPKQIQGFRLGSAREIANRRERLNKPQSVEPPVRADEVIRYLRQQDDVVVPQGDGF